jgi:peptide/nickel transport system substrate-binding protein
MKRSVFNSIFVFLILLSAALVSSCGDSASETDKTVFRYNESNGISSLDPAFSNNLENIWGCNQLFDGLLELDSQLKPQGLIARSW